MRNKRLGNALFVWLTAIGALLLVLLVLQVRPAASQAVDLGGGPGAAVPAPLTDFEWPEVVLYDNGPLVNCAGCGVGGADESVLQSVSLAMNTLGFGHQISAGNWVADDFTVTDASGWDVDSFTFFAYQTGSPTTSTLTDVNWELYDGDPSAGGTLIASGSGLDATTWSNIYRVTETTTGSNTDRPIMTAQTNTPGLFLPAGTYWLAWQTAGTLASGPWAPPITINGQTTTGNGLQRTSTGWAPALDSGSTTQQGFPFIIEGAVATALPSIEITKTVGTDAAVCASTTEITVAPGTDVYYCYAVLNTGDVTLTVHDLDDSELGSLISGFAFDLGPGASVDTVAAGLVISATIMTDTMNMATWTACNIDGPPSLTCADPAAFDVVSDTASAMVYAVVPPMPSIDVTATVGLDPMTCATDSSLVVGQPSTDVYYCYTVTNTGNITLPLHDIMDDVGTNLMGVAYDLAPGETANTVALGLTISETVTSATTNTVVWTAYVDSATTATASSTAAVTEQPTSVSLSGFSGDSGGALGPVWLSLALALVLGFALWFRRNRHA